MITVWIFDNSHDFIGEYDLKFTGWSYAMQYIFNLTQSIEITKVIPMETATRSVVCISLA